MWRREDPEALTAHIEELPEETKKRGEVINCQKVHIESLHKL